MTTKLKLSDENLAKLSQYESSIAHWSNEHTTMLLKARKLLDAIDSLYMSRQKIIDDLLAAHDIKPNDVSTVNVNPNGEIEVHLRSE